MIRPAVAMDGGNIDLVEIKDNNIYVRMGGACVGCPSSQITLRLGVETSLREQFPEMGQLITVD
jgi:Fe-S cluster biogenesis protein NfuA